LTRLEFVVAFLSAFEVLRFNDVAPKEDLRVATQPEETHPAAYGYEVHVTPALAVCESTSEENKYQSE
jgi:hypothetical protein